MKSGYDQFFKKAQQAAGSSESGGNSHSSSAIASNKKLTTQAKTKSQYRPSVFSETQSSSSPLGKNIKNGSTKMTSKELAQKLRDRVEPRASQKRKMNSFPWGFVCFLGFGLGFAFYGYSHIDQLEKIIQNVEVTVLGAAYAESSPATSSNDKEGTAEAKKKNKESAEGSSQSADGGKDPTKKNENQHDESSRSGSADNGPQKKFTEDEINHLSKLNERKRELDAREEELGKLEQELAAQRESVEKKMAELEATRKNISAVLEEKVQADDKKVENLVQVYSTMKPPQAAKALEEMDETLAIEIIGRMKKKNAAEIMNLIKPEKVKVFTEKYAGYKQK